MQTTPSEMVRDQQPRTKLRRRAIIPSHLRAWRLFRGLTLEQLAGRSGLTKGTINQIELGKKNFGAKSLRRLAEALRTTPSALYEPPDDRADFWSLWDDIREQGKAKEALAALRKIRNAKTE